MSARVPEPDGARLARLLGRTREDPESGCLEWTGAGSGNGYGYVKHNGKVTGAHRRAYELTHGAIPHGLVIRHACDNRLCINPGHLSVGTAMDNTADALERGRQAGVGVPVRAGERPEVARQVAAHRSGRAPGLTIAAIASGWGTSETTVRRIVREEARKVATDAS